MDYRTGIRLARDMADGEEAFLAALAGSSGIEPEAFSAFARYHKLREWLAPLARSERARAQLPDRIVSELEQTLAEAPARTRARVALCQEVRDALAAEDVPSLLLKGLAISTRFYGDPARRHQFDVDVLVRPEHWETALRVLAGLGYDIRTRRLEERRRKIRSKSPEQAPQTLTVERDGRDKLDLHVRTKSRWFHGIDESDYWSERRTFSVQGRSFETISDEHALVLLLVSIAYDLRRGATRAKHFLDLYLMLRAFEPSWDWEAFLSRPERRNLEKTLVNVLALLLTLWDCADAMPRLAEAVARRGALIEVRHTRKALRLVDRRGRSVGTRVWYWRLGSRRRLDRLAWRTMDLPHTVWRAVEPPHLAQRRLPWRDPRARASSGPGSAREDRITDTGGTRAT